MEIKEWYRQYFDELMKSKEDEQEEETNNTIERQI